MSKRPVCTPLPYPEDFIAAADEVLHSDWPEQSFVSRDDLVTAVMERLGLDACAEATEQAERALLAMAMQENPSSIIPGPPPDDDYDFSVFDEMSARREQRMQEAAELLKQTNLIAVGDSPHDNFLMLHPSTVIPGGWQVSLFDRRGPFSHTEGEDQDEVIADALDTYSLDSFRAMTEREFMDISHTPEFIHGSKQASYVGLVNGMTYKYGNSKKVRRYLDAAHNAGDIDEAIEILQRGMRKLAT